MSKFLLELELLALFSLAILPRTRLLCVVTLSCMCHTVQHVSNKAGFGTGFQPLLLWLDASSLCDCTFLLGSGRHFTNIIHDLANPLREIEVPFLGKALSLALSY